MLFRTVAAIVAAIKAKNSEVLKDPAASVDKLMLSREAIGGSVSGELRANAIWSVILALVGIGIYVSLRFETGFGVAAMVATLHDVLMTVALFVFFGKRRDAIKILFFDGTGLCLFYKRLDALTFTLPDPAGGDGRCIEVRSHVLDELLDGVSVESKRRGVHKPKARMH